MEWDGELSFKGGFVGKSGILVKFVEGKSLYEMIF